MAEPEFVLPVSEQEYQAASSKFVTLPDGTTAYEANVNKMFGYDIEVTEVDWENPGSSMRVVVTVTGEGVNQGKSEKIAFGVKADGIWKGKEIYKALTGKEMEMKDLGGGKRSPVIKPLELVGKSAVGLWQVMEGFKGGDPTQGKTYYPKLVNLLPAGSKVQSEGLGI